MNTDKALLNENLLSQIRESLTKVPEVLAAYVVGSVAQGVAGAESDFDLAVVVKSRRRVSEDDVYELIRHLEFPRDLDLSVVDKGSSPLFLFQIISKGKRVYEGTRETAVEFEAWAMKNYYDTAHMRNIYNRYLKEKFTNYTYAG